MLGQREFKRKERSIAWYESHNIYKRRTMWFRRKLGRENPCFTKNKIMPDVQTMGFTRYIHRINFYFLLLSILKELKR